MEETEERTDKQPRTDTDTDPESTQSRQKKCQIKPLWISLNSSKNCMTRLMQGSKTSRGRKDCLKQWQLPGMYLSTLSRSGSRLNIPDMARSLT